MSVASRRSAARKMKARYGSAQRRSVSEAIARERRLAAKQAAIKK
jgi:hypothetical protein